MSLQWDLVKAREAQESQWCWKRHHLTQKCGIVSWNPQLKLCPRLLRWMCAWNHHSQPFRSGAAQEIHCSEKAGLAYHWDRGKISSDLLPGNSILKMLLLNWGGLSSSSQTTESRGAAVPSPEERYLLPEGVCGIHNNICHLQGVPKPADVGQSAVLMEFSFLPAESAPLCVELIKYSWHQSGEG